MGLGGTGRVLVGDLLDLVTPGGGERFFEQPRRAVERDERTDLLVAQPIARVDDQLLGELDDRAVGPAEHGRPATLSASRGHRVNEQLYLIGHEGIEADELVFGEIGCPGRRLETDVGIELAPVGSEPVTDGLLAGVGLVQYAPAGDLMDVAGEEVDPEREPVLDPGVLDLTRLEAVDHVAQLLLRSDHQPQRAAPLLESLRKALEVEHARDAARDVLADLVDDEHDAPRAASPAPEQFHSPLSEPVMIDAGRARTP